MCLGIESAETREYCRCCTRLEGRLWAYEHPPYFDCGMWMRGLYQSVIAYLFFFFASPLILLTWRDFLSLLLSETNRNEE